MDFSKQVFELSGTLLLDDQMLDDVSLTAEKVASLVEIRTERFVARRGEDRVEGKFLIPTRSDEPARPLGRFLDDVLSRLEVQRDRLDDVRLPVLERAMKFVLIHVRMKRLAAGVNPRVALLREFLEVAPRLRLLAIDEQSLCHDG